HCYGIGPGSQSVQGNASIGLCCSVDVETGGPANAIVKTRIEVANGKRSLPITGTKATDITDRLSRDRNNGYRIQSVAFLIGTTIAVGHVEQVSIRSQSRKVVFGPIGCNTARWGNDFIN